jgi:hypothetical protein
MARLEVSLVTPATVKGDEFAAYVHLQAGLLSRVRGPLQRVLSEVPRDRMCLHFDVLSGRSRRSAIEVDHFEDCVHEGETLLWAECEITETNFFDRSPEERWNSLYDVLDTFISNCKQAIGDESPAGASALDHARERLSALRLEHQLAGMVRPKFQVPIHLRALYAVTGAINAFTQKCGGTKSR